MTVFRQPPSVAVPELKLRSQKLRIATWNELGGKYGFNSVMKMVIDGLWKCDADALKPHLGELLMALQASWQDDDAMKETIDNNRAMSDEADKAAAEEWAALDKMTATRRTSFTAQWFEENGNHAGGDRAVAAVSRSPARPPAGGLSRRRWRARDDTPNVGHVPLVNRPAAEMLKASRGGLPVWCQSEEFHNCLGGKPRTLSQCFSRLIWTHSPVMSFFKYWLYSCLLWRAAYRGSGTGGHKYRLLGGPQQMTIICEGTPFGLSPPDTKEISGRVSRF
jgi:hypothetical protein